MISHIVYLSEEDLCYYAVGLRCSTDEVRAKLERLGLEVRPAGEYHPSWMQKSDHLQNDDT